MTRDRLEEQLVQLDSPVDRLWWFAQMEQGIENADIDRKPRYGSKRVLRRLAQVYEPSEKGHLFNTWVKITVRDNG